MIAQIVRAMTKTSNFKRLPIFHQPIMPYLPFYKALFFYSNPLTNGPPSPNQKGNKPQPNGPQKQSIQSKQPPPNQKGNKQQPNGPQKQSIQPKQPPVQNPDKPEDLKRSKQNSTNNQSQGDQKIVDNNPVPPKFNQLKARSFFKWFFSGIGALGSFVIIYEFYCNWIQKRKMTQYYQENVKDELEKDVFTAYESYQTIQAQLQTAIKSKEYKKVMIIEGPPGIGKSTAIKNIIKKLQEDPKQRQKLSGNQQLEIFYFSFKGTDRQTMAHKLNELNGLMINLYKLQKDKTKNVVLVIDEINNICKPDYVMRIKQWRETFQLLKIIAFSSCSNSTEFFININGDDFNEKKTLNLNKQDQMYNFIKEKLKRAQINIDDQLLKAKSLKYSTFRKLAAQMKSFTDIYEEKYKSQMPANINEIFADYFNPKFSDQLSEKFSKTVVQEIQKYELSTGIEKQFRDQLENILTYASVNELLKFLADEYKMRTAKDIQFEPINPEIQKGTKNLLKLKFKRFIMLLKNRLYEENFIFNYSKSQTTAKSENIRQMMISWIDEQMKLLEQEKIIGKKCEKVTTLRQALKNIKFDLVKVVKINKQALDQIQEWKIGTDKDQKKKTVQGNAKVEPQL